MIYVQLLLWINVVVFKMGKKSVSESIKWQIIGMSRCNQTQREIAAKLGVSKTCVLNTIKTFQTSGGVAEKPRTGRPRITSRREDRYIGKLAKQNRKSSASQIKRNFLSRTGCVVSRSTILRRLKSQGLFSYVPLKKPLHTAQSRKVRRNWCRSKLNWGMEHWCKVLFSDEARFQLHSSRKVRVWRTPTEKFLPACLQSTTQGGGGSVMVWGCMSAKGVGILRLISGSMNTTEYVSTMNENMLPSADKLHQRYFVFQQDNAPCHKSRVTQQWFESKDIPVLEWPPRSPDLSPIENLWNIIGHRLGMYKPTNVHELRESIAEIWNSISDSDCLNLVRSMPNRIRACIKNAGGPIDY